MKKFGLLIMGLVLALAVSACATNPTPAPTPLPTHQFSPMPAGTGTPEVNPNLDDDAAATAAMTGPESSALSKKANDAAARISEIDSCITAIMGDTCLVGVSFDAKYQGALTERIRDMVTDRVQSVAPGVSRVAVTSDPEVAAQIGQVAEKIGSASTLGHLTGDFDAVLKKIQ